MDSEPPPALGDWQMAFTREQAHDFDDAKWLRTSDPEQMGSDGDHEPFAWYRTLMDIPRGGYGMLHLHGLDEVRVYINGKYVSGDQRLTADFVGGRNTVAVLVSHRGRYKQLGYIGSLEHLDDKGLFGPVTLDIQGQHLDLRGWCMRGGPGDTAQSTRGAMRGRLMTYPFSIMLLLWRNLRTKPAPILSFESTLPAWTLAPCGSTATIWGNTRKR